jgi:CheY-like chemotaxis protein
MAEPFHILIIEDNIDDEFMIRRAFQKAHIVNEIRCVRDGEEALEYLLHRERYAGTIHPMPGLVLLDLNLPKVTGKEFLAAITGHESLKDLPIVVLSVSDSTEDILDCYDSGVYAYLKKPLKPENILDFIMSEKFFGIYLVASPSVA